MTDQYLRKTSLIVANANQADDLSQLQFKFHVKQFDLETPNRIYVRIYNLSDATADKIQKEFTRVVLQAGYQDGNFGTIFDGTIIQVRRGRENPTDTYVEVTAAEGDQAFNFSIVQTVVAKGSTYKDRLVALQKAMSSQGIAAGYTPDLPEQTLARGRTFFGQTRDHLDDFAASINCRWSMQEGQLVFVPLTSYIPEAAIVLTSTTGMVGLPEQTQDGITVRCLLNPQIKIGKRVQINNKSVQQVNIAVNLSGVPNNAFLPSIAFDGFYRTLVVEHFGDTRGQEWYSDLICITVNESVTPGLAVKGYG